MCTMYMYMYSVGQRQLKKCTCANRVYSVFTGDVRLQTGYVLNIYGAVWPGTTTAFIHLIDHITVCGLWEKGEDGLLECLHATAIARIFSNTRTVKHMRNAS